MSSENCSEDLLQLWEEIENSATLGSRKSFRILANLSEEEVNILRKHPLISELSEFLSKVINKKEDLLPAV